MSLPSFHSSKLCHFRESIFLHFLLLAAEDESCALLDVVVIDAWFAELLPGFGACQADKCSQIVNSYDLLKRFRRGMRPARFAREGSVGDTKWQSHFLVGIRC